LLLLPLGAEALLGVFLTVGSILGGYDLAVRLAMGWPTQITDNDGFLSLFCAVRFQSFVGWLWSFVYAPHDTSNVGEDGVWLRSVFGGTVIHRSISVLRDSLIRKIQRFRVELLFDYRALSFQM
jgi:hypothetical protein